MRISRRAGRLALSTACRGGVGVVSAGSASAGSYG
jgi:hypothetical protein